MKIHEVMQLTGLTRKAVYYYERAGLLAPMTDPDNRYRNYSDEDIERLKLISTLRKLEMPVADIREMLRHPERAGSIFRRQLKRLDMAAAQLNQCRNALSLLIEAAGHTSNDGKLSWVMEADRHAEEAERERKQRSDYMARKLMELFPGTTGKYFAFHFGSFLNEPLAGEEKEKAWRQIVEYLDDTEPIDLPAELEDALRQMSEEEIVDAARLQRKQIQRFIATSETDYEDLREVIRRQTERLGKMPGSRGQAAFARDLKARLEEKGFYNVFVEQMRILSSDYRDYLELLERFRRDIGLRYDEDGGDTF